MTETSAKKYWVIAKVSSQKVTENGREKDHCCKWRVTDLLAFTRFLDKKWPGWCWFNVYEYTPSGNGIQLACFSKNKRPTSKHV